ncbi:MAG: hypothetical protein HC854_14665 [Flavobacterium sp.]|nr:hypothetical protein [Flavobacterium sp.]
MKKLNKIEMSATVGGLACGWVGILAVVTYASAGGAIIAHSTGLNSEIARCWNS